MIRSQTELDEIYRNLHTDLNTLFKLVFTFRKPISEGDVRIASVILRKWLVGGLLGEFCNAARITPTFYIVDNAEALRELKNQPTINFFLTGGVKFNGSPVFGTYHSSLPFQGKSLLPIDKMPDKEVGLSEFLRQKRLFFEGEYFSCEEIIHYTANKLGAHLDFKREGKFALLERASNFMKFGGPEPDALSMLNCSIYQALETKGAEVLSSIHIEIIAAATSLIQLKLDGMPLFVLKTKPSVRTRLRKAFGLKKPRFLFAQHPESETSLPK